MKKCLDQEQLISSVVSICKAKASEKGLTLHMSLPVERPMHCRGDEGKLRQILINLVGNAIKFTDSGSVSLTLEVSMPTNGVCRYRYGVADTGIGISEEDQKQLFDVFWTSNSGRVSDASTGLGLNISKQMVEVMGGTLRCNSVVGAGSEFWFELALPVIVKTCEDGYDGLNQWKLNSEGDLEAFLSEHGEIAESVVEKRVDFSREISLILVRTADGRTAAYPPTQNWHEGGILRASFAPAEAIDDSLAAQIEDLKARVFAGFDYVGVLAIECFVVDGKLLVNELAPRVHNSGHWTQQGAHTSQFENHLRAICNLPLGSTQVPGYAGMVNLLGVEMDAQKVLRSNAFFHTYNKSVRPNRKVGHINLVHSDASALRAQLTEMLAEIYD